MVAQKYCRLSFHFCEWPWNGDEFYIVDTQPYKAIPNFKKMSMEIKNEENLKTFQSNKASETIEYIHFAEKNLQNFQR